MHELSPGLRPPSEILLEAEKRATALKDVVKKTGASQKIGKSEHLKVEAWITISQFYGCTARCKDAEYIELGGVEGFKAHAYLVHDATGQIISEAIGYCMRDEERWNTRTKYRWENNQRIEDGTERVPLFQLASMAQTRAVSRVSANKFRWVVVLAGYHETPAEEMTGNEQEIAERKREAPKAERQSPFKMPWPARSKGKAIDDPAVPIEDLLEVLSGKQKSLGKPERKQYEAKDKIFIEAVKVEIAKRQAPAKQEIEGAWSDTIAKMRENNSDALALACEEFGVDDADAIIVDDRFRFAERWAHYVAQLSAK